MKPTIVTLLLFIVAMLPFQIVEALKCHSVHDDSIEEVTCTKDDVCLNKATTFIDPETDKQVTVFYPAGCGKCTREDIIVKCNQCSSDLCNNAASNCFGTNNEVIECKGAERQCFAFYRNKEVVSRGCGHCPLGDAHTLCNLCYRDLCNKPHLKCFDNSNKPVICKDGEFCIKILKSKDSKREFMHRGCGHCRPGEEACTECKENLCNVPPVLKCATGPNNVQECKHDQKCLVYKKRKGNRVIFKKCGQKCPRSSIVTTCEVCKEDDKECNEKGVQFMNCSAGGNDTMQCETGGEMCIRYEVDNNEVKRGCGRCVMDIKKKNCEECDDKDNCNNKEIGLQCFNSSNHLVECAQGNVCVTKKENGVVVEKGCGRCPTPKPGETAKPPAGVTCEECDKPGCNKEPTTTTAPTTPTTSSTTSTTPTTKKKKRKIIWTPPTPKDGFTIASFLLGGR